MLLVKIDLVATEFELKQIQSLLECRYLHQNYVKKDFCFINI